MIDKKIENIYNNKIFKSCFRLTKAELSVFNYFLENSFSEFQAEELSSLMDLNLTTVQRAVKKMTQLGILVRKQINLNTGGYFYSYKIMGFKKIKLIAVLIKEQRLKILLERWGIKKT